MQDDRMGSERVDIVCRALPKTIPSYLGSFTFCRRSVMSQAPLSIIARASGRHYPVFQSLYRGFPHPHIRTGHESMVWSGAKGNDWGVVVGKFHNLKSCVHPYHQHVPLLADFSPMYLAVG